MVSVKDVEGMSRNELRAYAQDDLGLKIKAGIKVEELRELVLESMPKKPAKSKSAPAPKKKGKSAPVEEPEEDLEEEIEDDLDEEIEEDDLEEEEPVEEPAALKRSLKNVSRESVEKAVEETKPEKTPPAKPKVMTLEDLFIKWSVLEGKLDRILSAIEVEEPTPVSRPPAKERGPEIVPPAKAPLPEVSLEEKGYVSVTVDEIEAMDHNQRIELAKVIGVDHSGGSERILKKRLINFITNSVSAKLYEDETATVPKGVGKAREKADGDPQILAMQKEFKKKGFNAPCGMPCQQCEFSTKCHAGFFVTKLYSAPDKTWADIGIPESNSIRDLWLADAKTNKISKAIAAYFAE